MAQVELGTPGQKRKRSPSTEAPPANITSPTKAARQQNQLQINYLVRQYTDNLPLIATDEPLPNLVHLLNEYHGVLDRHESMAANLGARPLGPILVRRFERMFDGPPKVLKTNSKDKVMVTWLDVVEFARSKPDQFNLSQMSEGTRVCQFYAKQCRVQISEEDFVLIMSGIPQKMIPPQPIIEDEEKELGTLEILEKTIGQISHLADQVAARARLFNHRLRTRKRAIVERRTAESAISGAAALRASSPSNVALMNGVDQTPLPPGAIDPAANTAQHNLDASVIQELMQSSSTTIANPATVSQATRDELMKNFITNGQRPEILEQTHLSMSTPHQPAGSMIRHYADPAMASVTRQQGLLAGHDASSTPYAHHYPSSPHPSTTSGAVPSPARHVFHTLEGGAFRAEMIARVEALAKGERVLPPCDRCRRLHMDCVKNLTACIGCTKKHAKCSWKDVVEEELHQAHFDFQDVQMAQDHRSIGNEADASGEDARGFHVVSHGGPRLDELATEAHYQAAHSLAIAAMDRSTSDGQQREGVTPSTAAGPQDVDDLNDARYRHAVQMQMQGTTDPQLQDATYTTVDGSGSGTPGDTSGSSGGGGDSRMNGVGLAVGT